MGSVKDYFSNLGTGIMSLLKGLQVTGKEFVTPKITESYPDNRNEPPVAPRFRAILELIYDKDGNHKCIACGTCERVCPNGTISLGISTRETWDGKKKKHLDEYIYDLGCCTFCNLCTINCPTDAIRFSNEFEQAVFTRDKLVKKLNYLPDKPEPQPTPEEIEKLKAEKEAKLAAAKAAAEAKKKAAAAQAADASAPADTSAPAEAAPLTAAPAADSAAARALAAAAGDPEKEAKIRAALEKAATLKAQRQAGKSTESK